MCVVLGVGVISVFDTVAFLACMHRVSSACPTFPLYKVIDYFVHLFSLSPTDRAGFRVKNVFDFKFFFVINQVGWRWRQDFLIREGWQDIRGQKLLIEAWVDLPMRRKLQFIGGGSCLIENHEGADTFIVELLLWTGKVKVGGIQPDLVADLVVARVLLLLVVLLLHVGSRLFKGVTGFGMDLGHFLHEVAGGGIGEGVVVGRVGEDSWVSSIEYGEWAFARRTVNSVVVGELSQREPIAPIHLSVVDKDLEVFLDLLVDSFGLSISLQVECR